MRWIKGLRRKITELLIDEDALNEMLLRRFIAEEAKRGSGIYPFANVKYFVDVHRAATPMDHPDRSVTRAKLARIEDSLIWQMIKGDVVSYAESGRPYRLDCFPLSYADKAIEAWQNDSGNVPQHVGRAAGISDFYFTFLCSVLATKDFQLLKRVAGADTVLGSEAVDITALTWHLVKLSCLGGTIKAFRVDMTTAKISQPDATFASGYFGMAQHARQSADWQHLQVYTTARLVAATSPSPEILAYFEVPIVGDGTRDNPFRALMPEAITPDGRNLLSMSHSALIPTDRATGRPIHGTAVVSIFGQPDREPGLRPIPDCLRALRLVKGVRELRRTEAISMALKMDDKLHPLDLQSVKELGIDERKAVREYISWRIDVLGGKEEHIDEKIMEGYIRERKW